MTNLTRRTFLSTSGIGLGSIALNLLLERDAFAAGRYRGLAGLPHHKPTAKRVIFLYMSGGPSHLETFDWKPQARRARRQADARIVHQGPADRAAPGARSSRSWGRSPSSSNTARAGQWISDFLPYHAKMADDICVIRSMHHRPDQPRPGPHDDEHRHGHQRPAVDGLVDHLRPGQRVGQSARLRRDDQRRRPQSAADRRSACGATASFPAASRASSSIPPATRFTTCATRRASPREQQRDLVDAVARTRPAPQTRRCTIPRSTRASPRTRWRFACRPACRN